MSIEITAFDERGCKSVLVETKDISVKAGEAQLLEAVGELARPIKEAKQIELNKISFPSVNVTRFQ